MKKWRNLFIGVGLLFVLILTVLFFPRPLLADFLFYEDQPQKADVIILLSGDTSGGRLEKAAELYHAGYAKKVLLTTATESGSTIEDAESLGIPLEDLLTENKATSTYENALYSKDIVLEHKFETALVVTSNYHMRRTRLAYERVFHDSDVTFTYVPHHPDSIARDSWNENKRVFEREYRKLIGGYFLYYDGPLTPLRKWLEKDE